MLPGKVRAECIHCYLLEFGQAGLPEGSRFDFLSLDFFHEANDPMTTLRFSRPWYSSGIFNSVLLAAVLAAVLALSGCGGSDSTGSVSIDTVVISPNPPTSGVAVSVNATVTGTSSNSAPGPATYVWTQVSGPTVALTGTDTATVYFTAPTVTANTDIVLNLTTTFSSATATKNITVTISP
jgi:hypothetical protein